MNTRALAGAAIWRARYTLAGDRITVGFEGPETQFNNATFEDYFDVKTCHDEEPVVRDMFSRLDESDVFWDVGAKIGLYGLLAADRVRDENAVIFEPSPERAGKTMANVELNDYDVTVFCAALGESPGYVRLADEKFIRGAGKLAVRVETGDLLIDSGEAPAPTVLKIDVEGAELNVLAGLSNALENTVETVYCEVHPEKLQDLGNTENDVYEFMDDFDFENERIKTPRKTGPAYLTRFSR